MKKKLHKHTHTHRIICSNKTKHTIFSKIDDEEEEKEEEEDRRRRKTGGGGGGGGELCGAATVGCLMTEMGRVGCSTQCAHPHRQLEMGEMDSKEG